jgi:hypothetical protein
MLIVMKNKNAVALGRLGGRTRKEIVKGSTKGYREKRNKYAQE